MSTKQCEDMLVGKKEYGPTAHGSLSCKIIRTNQPGFPVRIGGGVETRITDHFPFIGLVIGTSCDPFFRRW